MIIPYGLCLISDGSRPISDGSRPIKDEPSNCYAISAETLICWRIACHYMGRWNLLFHRYTSNIVSTLADAG